METHVDQTAIKFNQASIILLLLTAFVANQVWLVAFVALVMFIGTLWPAAALFKQIYQRLARPVGLLKANVRPDDPHSHLFAQGVGALFLIASTLALVINLRLLGWVLAWVVIVLAAVNLVAGFCLGCFFYYQLSRAGIHIGLPTWR